MNSSSGSPRSPLQPTPSSPSKLLNSTTKTTTNLHGYFKTLKRKSPTKSPTKSILKGNFLKLDVIGKDWIDNSPPRRRKVGSQVCFGYILPFFFLFDDNNDDDDNDDD